MPTISFAEAWRAYRHAETRLPAKPPPVAPRRVAGLDAIVEDFDLVVLDAWGVLNLGDAPIASALPAVASLRRRGKRLMVLSNDGSRDKPASLERHGRRGFGFAPDELQTGVELVPETLAALALPEPIGLITDPPPPLAALTSRMLALGDGAADYDRASGFLFLSSDEWTEDRQAMLQASLARRPRPLVVGNPDIASPELDAMAAEPGHYAHRIAAATGVRPLFCGKPFAPIYRRVRERHPDVAPGRVLCVGDTLHTDILGGRAAGYRALLVETGFCRGHDALGLAAESGIWPDFVAPQI